MRISRMKLHPYNDFPPAGIIGFFPDGMSVTDSGIPPGRIWVGVFQSFIEVNAACGPPSIFKVDLGFLSFGKGLKTWTIGFLNLWCVFDSMAKAE